MLRPSDMCRNKKYGKHFTYFSGIIVIFVSFLICYYVYGKHKNIDIKYILLWSYATYHPSVLLENETKAFIKNRCEYTNCYVTDIKDYLADIQLFHAVVFNGRDLSSITKSKRSPNQKYVFACLETPHNYPASFDKYDDFFNWTWTYRLDSDVAWTYFIAYNNSGIAVAPSKTVTWIKSDDEEEIDDELKGQLDNKTKAVAWFVSNCDTPSNRKQYVHSLQFSLKKYDMTVDIYGYCGNMQCPRSEADLCYEILAKNYYFYLSFENSLIEDYVTEKVLTALNHDTVPVVFGGADYNRFLPPGSYLNAMKMSPMHLAMTMHKIISDPTKKSYYTFFQWRKHYHFKDGLNSRVCDICALMNNWNKVTERSSYKNFEDWWNH